MFERVAKGAAQAELLTGSAQEASRREDAFLEMLLSLDFLPNSPTLMNAGTLFHEHLRLHHGEHKTGRQVLELGAKDQAYHLEHASQCDPDECRI